jgi:hypothetical protein
MRAMRTFLIAASALVLTAGCNPFYRAPVVAISDSDTNLNTRWHGTIASPSRLAGVVQMSGTATMAPGSAAGATVINVDIANASPGGEHPWSLHRGSCDRDEGLVGDRSGFKAVRIGNDGRGSASSTVNMHSPTSGRYSVWVRASEANTGLVVGCANLAAPSM